MSRRNMILVGVAGVVIVVGAWAVGHMSGSSIPGISGTPTASATPSTSGGVDQAQVAALMKKISENPNDADSLWNLGNIYFQVQDYKSAQSFYRMLVKVAPKDANAWIALGATAFNQQDQRLSFSAWSKAVRVDPKNVEAHYDLGFWYFSQQPSQTDKGQAEWNLVVELAPDSDFASTVKQHLSNLASPSATP